MTGDIRHDNAMGASQIMTTLKDRITTVLSRMAEDGVDTLIAVSNGHSAIDMPNPVAHLTEFRSLGPSLAVLRGDGRMALITTPGNDRERLAGVAGIGDLRATDDLVGAFRDVVIGNRGHNGRVVWVGMGRFPFRPAMQLLDLAECGAENFDDVFYRITGPKTDIEIERARKATWIAEQGLARMLEIARPGLRECDLAVDVNLRMKDLGANDCFLLLNGGRGNTGVMPSSERPLERGDVILAELSPSCEGQFTQICRTTILGPPEPVQVEKYDLLVRALGAGLGAVKSGVPMSDVCDAINRVLADAGYAKYALPPFIRRRGHGLGAGSIYPGDVAVDNASMLEEDMVFVVHPNQFLPETAYLMCGDPVRVGAGGVDIMSSRIASLNVIDL
jgi:hypothetical protein